MAIEAIPLYEPGQRITGRVATADVIAATFCMVSGSQAVGDNIKIKTCTAGARALGVISYDAKVGDVTSILRNGAVAEIQVGASALTAGQEIESDANGKAVALASGKPLGQMVYDGAANARSFAVIY